MSTIRVALAEQTAKISKITELVEQRDREPIPASALAPIRRLPVELLAAIFSLTIRDADSLFPNDVKHFRDAYRVSHICSEWRQIAVSTPQLWTGPVTVRVEYPVTRDVEDPDVEHSVVEDVEDPDAEDVEDAVAQNAGWTVTATGPDADGLMLRAWLAHSDPLPMPIILMGLNGLSESVLAGWEALHLRPVLEELLRVAPRWGILHLYGFLPPIFYQRSADCTLDSLEEACLGTYDDGSNPAPALSLLGNSPRLRKLNLHLFLLDPPGTSVTLPCLRVLHLTVHSKRNTHLFPLLEFLSAPMLETCSMSFKSRAGSMLWKQAVFTTFLLRSPNVTHLSLHSCPLTSHDLLAALTHVPSLTHLELDNCHCLDNTFLLALHYKVDTPSLAPLLHVLRLIHIPESLTESPIIVGMLASRWRAGSATARWSRVTLSPPPRREFTKDFRDAIRELEHQGIPVEIIK